MHVAVITPSEINEDRGKFQIRRGADETKPIYIHNDPRINNVIEEMLPSFNLYSLWILKKTRNITIKIGTTTPITAFLKCEAGERNKLKIKMGKKEIEYISNIRLKALLPLKSKNIPMLNPKIAPIKENPANFIK